MRRIIPKNNDLVGCSKQTSTHHNRTPWMTSLGGFMVSFLLVFTFPHFSLSWTLILFFYKGKIQQTNKNTMTCSQKLCTSTPVYCCDYTSDRAVCQEVHLPVCKWCTCVSSSWGGEPFATGFPTTCISNTQPCLGNSGSNRSAQQCHD